ncbi:DMT family transporter [Parasphingorhabdus halotolerans]|uniref:EamA family transporter n=1 Tax=Parasphingorhabdus halotolerans TaxID=2725558 RepID=A0A6H2DJ94_9SPHN|nr:EamA family transporter [Parasphingorhabdus halotolerans]QJB68749.1 EamA family transporter [Parasphingorhabdus halotolerans]
MSQEDTAEVSLLTPRILIPFLLVSLIWGSTWLVIKDQISDVAPSWSVSYRFLIAAAAMFVLVGIRKHPFRLDRTGQILAVILGFFQFTFNFNFVYNAELYITSGLVAVLFALLMVPNAVLGRIFLGHKITGAFLGGSAIAAVGIAMLFLHEYRASPASLEQVLLGAALTFGGIMSASIANVMQAGERLKAYPIISILAWAMLWGALINIVISWITVGPPQYEMRAAYWGGIFYLGVIGSVVTFPLYFSMIREIGPGRAAYSSVLVPVVAMILSTIFENYVWTWLSAGGAVLAMIGLLVALAARKPKTPRISG